MSDNEDIATAAAILKSGGARALRAGGWLPPTLSIKAWGEWLESHPDDPRAAEAATLILRGRVERATPGQLVALE